MYIFYDYNEKKEEFDCISWGRKKLLGMYNDMVWWGISLEPVSTLTSIGVADIGPENNKFLLLQVGNGTHWFGLIISLLKALPKCVGNV